jgi:hypothetical protein
METLGSSNQPAHVAITFAGVGSFYSGWKAMKKTLTLNWLVFGVGALRMCCRMAPRDVKFGD